MDKPVRRLASMTESSEEAAATRRHSLRDMGYGIDQIVGLGAKSDPLTLAGRIEGFVGYAQIPLGVAGPVQIQGKAAQGHFFIPLATSEGRLVASFQHAFNVINRCGGAAAVCSSQRVSRAPCFEFPTLFQAMAFTEWVAPRLDELRAVVEAGSGHCRLLELHTSVVGNAVYMPLEFATGDAAGQNMVTTAAQRVCEHLLGTMPVQPHTWMVESVLSGDKRASALAFRSARGRNASAEILIPARQIERYWRTTVDRFVHGWSLAIAGSIQTGAIGLQGNVANAMAALFIACGQDVACVVEATTALTRIERTLDGDVYVSVTLPNLIVGTVGGGTSLPTARESLALMGCVGSGKAAKFAEICAVVALAGELAIAGAMAGGHFAKAHSKASQDGREGL